MLPSSCNEVLDISVGILLRPCREYEWCGTQARGYMTKNCQDALQPFVESATTVERGEAGRLADRLLPLKQTSIVARREVQRCGPNSLREGKALDEALRELVETSRVRLVSKTQGKDIMVNPHCSREGHHKPVNIN